METGYRKFLPLVAATDAAVARAKDEQYGASWIRRGWSGAFHATWRKADRIESIAERANYLIGDVVAREAGKPDGLLDDIRDLRRYLLLWECRLIEEGRVPLPATAARLPADPASARSALARLMETIGTWTVDIARGGTSADLAPPPYFLDALRVVEWLLGVRAEYVPTVEGKAVAAGWGGRPDDARPGTLAKFDTDQGQDPVPVPGAASAPAITDSGETRAVLLNDYGSPDGRCEMYEKNPNEETPRRCLLAAGHPGGHSIPQPGVYSLTDGGNALNGAGGKEVLGTARCAERRRSDGAPCVRDRGHIGPHQTSGFAFFTDGYTDRFAVGRGTEPPEGDLPDGLAP